VGGMLISKVIGVGMCNTGGLSAFYSDWHRRQFLKNEEDQMPEAAAEVSEGESFILALPFWRHVLNVCEETSACLSVSRNTASRSSLVGHRSNLPHQSLGNSNGKPLNAGAFILHSPRASGLCSLGLKHLQLLHVVALMCVISMPCSSA